MSRFKKVVGLIALLGMFSTIQAKPIRVLILKIVYSGGYLHSSIKNGTPQFEAMLKNPAGLTGAQSLVNSTLGTGDSIVVPEDGFIIDTVGNATQVTSTSASVTKFMSLLDSADVLVMSNTLGFGGIITSANDRAKFLEFAATKGIVAWHSANDNHSSSSTAPTWAAYDSLCGALFKDHATANALMLQDTLPFNTTDSNFAVLNKGLLSSYRFNEELYSLTKNPRTNPGFHVLYTLDEKVYTPSTRMGDHPYSYYNESLSGRGGRYWYTSEGHTDSLFQKNYSYRRQFYNAVLWAARYQPAATAIRAGQSAMVNTGAFKTSIAGSALMVTAMQEGAHTVEIRGLDGKIVASERGNGMQVHTFNLRPNSVYSVTTTGLKGRQSKLVTLQ